MKEIKPTLGALKKYLKAGGSKNGLAETLGYESSQAIDKWLARKSIPKWVQKRLAEALNKKN